MPEIYKITQARKVELYKYLIKNHKNDFLLYEDNSIHFINNLYIIIKLGYSGFYNYKTKEKGNSIDFLMKYLNYTFEEAVESLLNNKNEKIDEFIFSEFPNPLISNIEIFDYFCNGLKFSKAFVSTLIGKEKVIQYETKNNEINIAFINKNNQDYFEENSSSVNINHNVVHSLKKDSLWYFDYFLIKEIEIKNIYYFNKAIDAVKFAYLLYSKKIGYDCVFVAVPDIKNKSNNEIDLLNDHIKMMYTKQ